MEFLILTAYFITISLIIPSSIFMLSPNNEGNSSNFLLCDMNDDEEKEEVEAKEEVEENAVEEENVLNPPETKNPLSSTQRNFLKNWRDRRRDSFHNQQLRREIHHLRRDLQNLQESYERDIKRLEETIKGKIVFEIVGEPKNEQSP